MKLKSFPLSKVYQLLEPGPVVLVTTSHLEIDNVMTMSWHTMLEYEPPLIGCVISNRDFTFERLKAAKECVIAIPTVELAGKVIKIGNTTGRDTKKFEKFQLHTLPASNVKALLIKECFANLECKVVDTTLVDKYCFFILEVVKAWADSRSKNPQTIHHRGKGNLMVAGKTIKFPSRMD